MGGKLERRGEERSEEQDTSHAALERNPSTRLDPNSILAIGKEERDQGRWTEM